MQETVIDWLNKPNCNTKNFLFKGKWRDPYLLPCSELEFFARTFFNEVINKKVDLYKNFDVILDRCFCKNCEPKELWVRGDPPERYALPIGYYRIGIKMRKEYIDKRLIISTWHVGFHGTKVRNVSSIIEHRRIMFPGNTLNNGEILPMAHNNCFAQKHFGNKPVIYVSPSPKYAGADLYAEPYEYKGKKIKVLIQCRIKPGSYRVERETLALGDKNVVDSNFKNNELEWMTDDRQAFVPYGILIGVFN